MNPLNDTPIEQPADDQFGLSPFAKALADSISKNENPEGTVIAINGPWGSGKSSAINLVKHYLEKKINPNQSQNSFEFPRSAPNCLKSLPKRHSRKLSSDTNNSSNMSLEIVNFKCWWFKGEEALVTEFFHQLYRALDKSGFKENEAVRRLGLMTLRDLAVPSLTAGVPIIGGIIEKMVSYALSKRIQYKKTVEMLYNKISKALVDNSQKRYLMIIDDIDRLSEDEALLIFRLIKSVGRLPKITYLLAYDREVAEKIVSKRYPSEGPRYLEKIVQASFDIPYPLRSDLQRFFIKSLDKVWEEPRESKYWREYQASGFCHFHDLFDDVVAPQIQSPRDVIRITNALKVSWPAVAGEVDPADFMALETLRIQLPRLHAILKVNREQLTGRDLRRVGEKNDITASRYEDIFLGGFQNEKRTEIKRALRSLFPSSLGTVWRDTNHGSTLSDNERDRQRRACSPKHFDTYFRFSLSKETVNINKVNEFIQNSNNVDYVKTEFLKFAKIQRKKGSGTRVSIFLDELMDHAKTIPIENAKNFLSTLFKIHDIIDIDLDESTILFMLIDNSDRIYYLLRNFLLDRTDLAERSEIISYALQNGSLGWIACLVSREYHNYHPSQGQSPKPEDECFLTEADLENLRQMVLEKIRNAAEDSSLLINRKLFYALDTWRLLGDSNEEVKSWCMKQLDEDTAVEIFAKIFVQQGRSVSSISIPMNILERFFDTGKLICRINELLAASEQDDERYIILECFRNALNQELPH